MRDFFRALKSETEADQIAFFHHLAGVAGLEYNEAIESAMDYYPVVDASHFDVDFDNLKRGN